jgi:hypothetical protein
VTCTYGAAKNSETTTLAVILYCVRIGGLALLYRLQVGGVASVHHVALKCSCVSGGCTLTTGESRLQWTVPGAKLCNSSGPRAHLIHFNVRRGVGRPCFVCTAGHVHARLGLDLPDRPVVWPYHSNAVALLCKPSIASSVFLSADSSQIR